MAEKDSGKVYLAAAFICERILEEKDGIKTAVRILDKIRGIDTETIFAAFTLFIKLRCIDKTGSFKVSFRLHSPDGSEEDIPAMQMIGVLSPGNKSLDFIVDTGYSFNEAGLYWFFVFLNDEPLTEIPLEIVFQVVPL
ncbi:MAG: DUF6941 family protein [Leptospirillum sp.]